ncbi:hypothetical protein [Streptomyces sp. NPDC002845]
MKTSDVLIGLILVPVGGGLALLLGGGLPSQAVLALFVGVHGRDGRMRRKSYAAEKERLEAAHEGTTNLLQSLKHVQRDPDNGICVVSSCDGDRQPGPARFGWIPSLGRLYDRHLGSQPGTPMLRFFEKASDVLRGAMYVGALVVTPWFAVSALRKGDVVFASVNAISFTLVLILVAQRVRQYKEKREGKP